MLSCVLCLLAACGPQGTTSSNADSSSPEDSAADSSSSLPADVSEIKLNDESDIETMLEGTPGLEMREFYGAGTYHSMYVLDYLCEDTANNQWVYQLYCSLQRW